MFWKQAARRESGRVRARRETEGDNDKLLRARTKSLLLLLWASDFIERK